MRYVHPALTSILCASLALLPLFAPAQPLDTRPEVSPQTISGTVRVDAEGLIKLYADIPQLTVIDARIAGDRKFGYIENSISLPDTDTNCQSLAKVIPRLDSPVAFYCNGPKCGRSAVSAKIAVQCGYQEIYWFRGGIEEWTAKHYPLLK